MKSKLTFFGLIAFLARVLAGITLALSLFIGNASIIQAKEKFDSDMQDYPSAEEAKVLSEEAGNEAWMLDSPELSSARAAASAASCSWSPNNFPVGQCTWYTDGRVYQNGWRLQFTQSYGRDAYKWWDMVTNANKGQLGYPGDIMVFSKSSNLPYGHVAYVESTIVAGKKWNVLHVNWARGTVIGTKCGYNIRRVTVEKMSTGKVRVGGSSTTYPLSGFLYRK